MKKSILLLVITIVAMLPLKVDAQLYVEWEQDTPDQRYSVLDKNGNFYFINRFTPVYLNKINSDGTPGWQIGITSSEVGKSGLHLDQSGNIIIPFDSIPFNPNGGYSNLTSYLKYSPSGLLISNPSILEPLFAHPGTQYITTRIDFADNVLVVGSETEWLPCDGGTCGYPHLRITFMNDAGAISRITVDGGTESILEGSTGNIIGPDANDEFIVQYTNKQTQYPFLPEYYELRCSVLSGVIWKQERNPSDNLILGPSGAIYRPILNGITKYDRMNNLEWRFNNPTDLTTFSVYENPIDYSLVNFLVGGTQPNTLICLEQDGSFRWRRNATGTFHGFDSDGNVLVETSDTVLQQINYIDGNIISSSPNIHIFGKIFSDTLGNVFVVSRYKIAKLASLPELIVKDAQDNTLSNIDFYLIKVADDAPNYTPDTLGIVTTDADGKIKIQPVQ